jgi:uncharacterized protein (UPF0548 family)
MFYLSRPAHETIEAFISSQQNLAFSYPEIGATREQAPKGYTLDHNRIQLGIGAETFERAKAAIQNWKMFEVPGLRLCWPNARIEAGATVALLAAHFGLCSLHACRIVYVLDQHGATERYGFAYGTLPAHGVIGEERFTVEYHTRDQSVWYDLYAFSRPTLLATLAYPFARTLQRRFARDSKAAMQNAVQKSKL